MSKTSLSKRLVRQIRLGGRGAEVIDRRAFLKYTASGISVAALSPLLGACSEDEPGSTSGGRDQISADITVAAYPIPVHSVVYAVALEDGIFEKHGWDVTEVVGSSGGGTTVRNIVTGDLPMGEVAGPSAIQAWLSGAPLRIISQTINSPAEIVMTARNDTPFSSMDDVVGKRIGYTQPGSSSESTHSIFLDSLGLLDRVEMVATGGLSEGLALLDRGEIDFMHNLEQLYAATADQHKIVWRVSDEIPRHAYSFAVAGERFSNEDPGLVRSYLEARSEAVDRVYEDPVSAGQVFATVSELPEDGCVAVVETMVAEEGIVRTGYGNEDLDVMLNGMVIVGQLDQEERDQLPLSDMIDQSFIPEDQRISL